MRQDEIEKQIEKLQDDLAKPTLSLENAVKIRNQLNYYAEVPEVLVVVQRHIKSRKGNGIALFSVVINGREVMTKENSTLPKWLSVVFWFQDNGFIWTEERLRYYIKNIYPVEQKRKRIRPAFW